jgi:hypothetical protein
MTKPTVVKLFVGGIVAVIAGVLVALLAVWGAFASGVFQMNGEDVVGVNVSPLATLMLGLAVGGVVAIVGGGIAGLVSWIGALLNTADLDSKGWFLVLLLLGIFNFGFIAMIVYVLAGPDGTTQRRMAVSTPA